MTHIARFAIISLLFAMTTMVSAGDGAKEPSLLAVKFHADWCGSCKTMGSVFEDLQGKLDGKAVAFVTLDKTNQSTKAQAQLMAGALGITKAYNDNKGTGFILILDANSKKVVAKLTKAQTFKQMVAEIDGNLS